VVGAGNWLLACDLIGPQVLERIKDRYDPRVELCDVGTTGLGLLDHLHAQQLLLVVDACALDQGPPGKVHVVEPDLDQADSRSSSVHQIGPLETLTVAKLLYPEQLPRRIRLILVETTDDIGEEVLEQACQQVVAILDREISGALEQTMDGPSAAP
jgi:hydrogenase maturation protease